MLQSAFFFFLCVCRGGGRGKGGKGDREAGGSGRRLLLFFLSYMPHTGRGRGKWWEVVAFFFSHMPQIM